jgi:hypothetical protein
VRRDLIFGPLDIAMLALIIGAPGLVLGAGWACLRGIDGAYGVRFSAQSAAWCYGSVDLSFGRRARGAEQLTSGVGADGK